MLENGAYLQMPNEDWACKIMVNILVNSGIDANMNESKKEELLHGLSLYSAYSQAMKEGEESGEA